MRIIQPFAPSRPAADLAMPASQATRAPASTRANSPTTETEAPRRNRFATNRTAGSMPVWNPTAIAASFAPDAAGGTAKVETGQKMTFKDMLDVINPLQHIPVVSAMYRKTTGDMISPTAQFMGGMLFGGPIGAAAAMADVAIREQTGRSVADRVTGFATHEKTADTPVKLAARWDAPSRMAGTQPVWSGNTPAATRTASAPDQNFTMLLNGLAAPDHNIS